MNSCYCFPQSPLIHHIKQTSLISSSSRDAAWQDESSIFVLFPVSSWLVFPFPTRGREGRCPHFWQHCLVFDIHGALFSASLEGGAFPWFCSWRSVSEWKTYSPQCQLRWPNFAVTWFLFLCKFGSVTMSLIADLFVLIFMFSVAFRYICVCVYMHAQKGIRVCYISSRLLFDNTSIYLIKFYNLTKNW